MPSSSSSDQVKPPLPLKPPNPSPNSSTSIPNPNPSPISNPNPSPTTISSPNRHPRSTAPQSPNPIRPPPHSLQSSLTRALSPKTLETHPSHSLQYQPKPYRVLPRSLKAASEQGGVVFRPSAMALQPPIRAYTPPFGVGGAQPGSTVPHALGPRLVGVGLGGQLRTSSVSGPKIPLFSSSPSTCDFKREKYADNSVAATINDRKVRIADGGFNSLYALCRSWVRNGMLQENQHHLGENVNIRTLPGPAALADCSVLKSKSGEVEDDETSSNNEEEDSAEHLNARDLLMQHIKHAKRVRIRLKEERLRRIKRFNQRLRLLLPPPPPDQNKTDPPAGV
ncbi:proline-rich receptor-like protein kinase PERK9 [Amborella trichopoda]|uniref:Uncharacterized protein n=1 Tax=Amborella trichopoda TaxID=13333 RepID=W1PM65_AMBTC|nr:proline-rich receptor-like protein kinase PERK9 [Amborella trichopoda]ERN11117.1 hypothetical protein AMTR_s00024p00160570 [Amborella trichopoda]|eukprot:XP_006849536.1 proline-rich receptor-like protein kinase PERK9 [Amborella trichopoda]